MNTAEKKEEKLNREKNRIMSMFSFEQKYYDFELNYIAGIDEAGRGPLAGPVVAAAVILPKYCEILYLNDSKKLSPKRRESLFYEIMEKAVAVGIGIISHKEIDEINIERATKKAMIAALNNLSMKPEAVLIDGIRPPATGILQESIIRGDEKSCSIAAASIVAKVTRDRLMITYGDAFPEYGFAKHKGYGTREHIDAITLHGICPLHRRSFINQEWFNMRF